MSSALWKPCWPQIWDVFVHIRWDLIALIVAVPGLMLYLLWAPGVRRKWMKNTFRFIGGLIAGCLLVASPAVLLGVLFAAGNPPSQYRSFSSPDGRYTARLEYDAGFLGRDYSEVTVKTRDCCRRIRVFSYDGPSDMTTMHLKWLSDTRLQVTYNGDTDRYQTCTEHSGSLTVACVRMPWPEAKQELKPASGPNPVERSD